MSVRRVVVGAFAASVCLAVWRRIECRGLPVRYLSTTERTRKLLQFGGRVGAAYAAHRAKRVFASSGRQEEFGRRPEELFAEWDPQPIAAASIG